MSARLSQILDGSVLLGPFTRLSKLSHVQIGKWFEQSNLAGMFFRPIGNTLAPLGTKLSASTGTQALVVSGLTLVCALLFCCFTVFDTGPIGALTWLLWAGCMAFSVLFNFKFFQKLTAIDLLVALFLGSAIVSTAFSSFVKTSVVGLSKMLTFVAGYAAFRVLVSLKAFGGKKVLYLLLGLLVLLAIGESLIGFYQFINHIQPLATWEDPSVNPELKMNRIFGTLKPSNPNLLAGFLIPSFPTATGLALIAFIRKNWLGGVAFLGMAGIILLALVLTGSRGGFLAIGGMMITLFAIFGHLIWNDAVLKHQRRFKTLWLVILVGSILLAGLAFAASPSLQHRVTSIFAMREDSSNSYRLNVYQSAVKMFKDNPVIGIGPGNGTFKLVYGLYMVPGYNALGAYSVPLEIAVEQGIIGLAIFLLMMICLKIRTIFFLDSDKPLEDKLLVALLFTGIVGSFIYGFFDTIWYRPAVNLLFWFFVAALAYQTEAITTSDRHGMHVV